MTIPRAEAGVLEEIGTEAVRARTDATLFVVCQQDIERVLVIEGASRAGLIELLA